MTKPSKTLQILPGVRKLHWVISHMMLWFILSAGFPSLVLADVQTITRARDLAIACQQAISAIDTKSKTATTANQNDAFVCMAYLAGMMSTAHHANDLAKLRYALATNGRGDQRTFNLYCFDWQLPYAKIARIVTTYAKKHGRNNPALLDQPAHQMALQALQAAFPCH